MLLRAFGNLSNGIRRGEMFAASRLKPETVELLIGRGLLAQVGAPPVAVLDELAGIADVLESVGVVTLEDLIEAKAVAGLTAEELTGWQSVAIGAMNVEKPCRCGRK